MKRKSKGKGQNKSKTVELIRAAVERATKSNKLICQEWCETGIGDGYPIDEVAANNNIVMFMSSRWNTKRVGATEAFYKVANIDQKYARLDGAPQVQGAFIRPNDYDGNPDNSVFYMAVFYKEHMVIVGDKDALYMALEMFLMDLTGGVK